MQAVCSLLIVVIFVQEPIFAHVSTRLRQGFAGQARAFSPERSRMVSMSEDGLQVQQLHNPLIVAVLMIKNEAHVICQTLQPLVDAGIDSYFIFDTGSTDGTVGIVTDYLKKNNIQHVYIDQEPFVNFAVSRNRCLELAEQRFPQAVFMLLLDAEWYLQHADKLVAFCRQHKNAEFDAYLMRLKTEPDDFFSPKLIRPRAHFRYVGAVHEYLDVSVVFKMPEDICFVVRQSKTGEEATKKRMQRDCDLLLCELANNPNDVRTLYFLGQTHVHMGDLETAYRWYRRAVACNNENVEKSSDAYQACYVSGMIADELSKKDDTFSWQLALNHYFEAFSICPLRAEPLIKIARHYWDAGNMYLCFLFAKHAAEIPFPKNIIDPLNRISYDFDRYDLLGASAAMIGKLDIAEWALLKALQAQPDNQNIRHNLAVVMRRILPR